MKTNQNTFGKFQLISPKVAASITGGNNSNDEDEYIIVYIEGVPYKIRKNKKGEQISEPERIY